MLVWGSQGLRAKMKREGELLSGLVMALYVNDLEPKFDTEADDFDIASFSGYQNVKLDEWGIPFVSGPALVSLLHPVVSFSWTGSGVAPKVYGYVVMDVDTEHWYYAMRYKNAPFVFTPEEPTFYVVPRMDVRSIG